MFWEFPESELILHEQPQHHHQQPRHKVCTIIISTVQMWKLRHREVKEHSQGHTARKWRTGIQVFALKGLHSSVVRPASLPSIFSRLGRGGQVGPCPGAHNPSLPGTFQNFPRGLGRLERGERATLWWERESENLAPFSMCTFHWASPTFWYFRSWKCWHTSHWLYLI